MKRRAVYCTMILVSIIAIASLQGVHAATSISDSADDVKGLQVTSDYDLLEETNTYSFIDIRNVKWNYDSSDFNVSLKFQDDVNTTKILNNQVSGWTSFGLEPALNTNIVPLVQFSYNKTDNADTINLSCTVFDGDAWNHTILDCGSISGVYINWSVSIDLFANFTDDDAVLSEWTANSFSMYTFNVGDTDYIFWDSVSVESFWDELYDSLGDMEQVPGFDSYILIGVISVVSGLILALKHKKISISRT